MNATKQEIGARVDALAEIHDGDEFVSAVEQLAEEVGPDGRPLLQEVLLERAAEEEGLQQAIHQRAAAKGWTRRMLDRLDNARRDEQAERVATAVQEGAEGEEALTRELAALREDRGRAAIVLDELARHGDARVRRLVPGAAVEILGDDASRLVLSLARDRESDVRDAAVAALVSLGPEAARPALPDLRRRLHATDPQDRIAAMRALAEVGDDQALATIEERTELADSPEERREAEAAAAALRAGGR